MTKQNTRSGFNAYDQQFLASAQQRINAQPYRLREVVPVVLDMPFREATLSSRYGQTLEGKERVVLIGQRVWLH